MSYPWIRASEIAEYAYCSRAWWLKQVRGWQITDRRPLQAGDRYHRRHGNQVRQISWMRRLAYVLLFVAVAFIVFQLLMSL